jgi:hypothetical protein
MMGKKHQNMYVASFQFFFVGLVFFRDATGVIVIAIARECYQNIGNGTL